MRFAKLFALTLLFVLSSPAAKNRDWKSGKVVDYETYRRTYVTGATSNSSTRSSATGTVDNGGAVDLNTESKTTTNTTLDRTTIKENHILLVGDQYIFELEDSTRRVQGGPTQGPEGAGHQIGSAIGQALANRKHGCRFIVGGDVRFAQEKAVLYVVDADGKECKMEIVKQILKQ